jgi:predicted DsbA family dithiol-disulfide isomerase
VSSSLEELKKHYEVDVQWRSFQLRPPGAPPMPEWKRQQIEAGQESFKARVREAYGFELNPAKIEADTRPALILEKYAQEQDKGAEFHHAVEVAHWLEARHIDDVNELKAIMQEVGLGDADINTILTDPKYIQQVDHDQQQAYMNRLNGVPALVFENKYLVSGAQPYEVLKQVVEQVQEEQ